MGLGLCMGPPEENLIPLSYLYVLNSVNHWKRRNKRYSILFYSILFYSIS
jgi:hypothetical protein